jgi:Raf kinase inhibitor-like YbhB/YbcL family protein
MKLTNSLICLVAGVAIASAQQPPAARPAPRPALLMTTTGWTDGGTDIPKKFTCAAGADMVSPALVWKDAPPATQSFALLLHDPEPHIAKSRYDITHWMIWNIPADAKGLPENVAQGTADLPDGSRQGKAYNRKAGYAGPCAPPGNPHHYTYQLFALDTKLDLSPDATRDDLEKAIDGHVLSSSEIIAQFHQ